MAEIVEKQELPVTITKVKIGTKDLTKKLIDQLPFSWYIYCNRDDGREWGLPYEVSEYSDELIFNKKKPYITDGTLLGYIRPTWNDKIDLDEYRRSIGEFNNAGIWYFILWYTPDGKLKKGYIDSWTLTHLKIELEQIFI